MSEQAAPRLMSSEMFVARLTEIIGPEDSDLFPSMSTSMETFAIDSLDRLEIWELLEECGGAVDPARIQTAASVGALYDLMAQAVAENFAGE